MIAAVRNPSVHTWVHCLLGCSGCLGRGGSFVRPQQLPLGRSGCTGPTPMDSVCWAFASTQLSLLAPSATPWDTASASGLKKCGGLVLRARPSMPAFETPGCYVRKSALRTLLHQASSPRIFACSEKPFMFVLFVSLFGCFFVWLFVGLFLCWFVSLFDTVTH